MAANTPEAFTRQNARPHLPRWRRRRLRTGITLVALVSLSASVARAVELESVSISGVAGNAESGGVAVNANGEFVAFWSDASNLVVHDTNQVRDVFVRDRAAATTQRVDVSSSGDQSNGPSHADGFSPAISGDGKTVAFYSDATNLVPNDANGQTDVFVRDRTGGTTELISVSTAGTQGNGDSLYPSISADGTLVAFQSQATNLVTGAANNFAAIFVRDRTAGTTERPCDAIQSQANGGSSNPAISADGSVVAFHSAATNLIPKDTNNHIDVFVCDRTTGTIELISQSTAGGQGDGDSILPAISQDGRFVAFKSSADNLVPDDTNRKVDVFLRDRVAQTTIRVSVNVHGGNADDNSYPPSISYDGRFVSFGSAATNLVTNDFNGLPSVFVRDLQTMLTLLVDVNDKGQQANGATPDVATGISGDGKQIGFVSLASNLVDNDHNGLDDVFITRNPFSCDDQHPCPGGLVCNQSTGFCEVAPATPTATPSPPECCQCQGSCAPAQMGMCMENCELVSSAVCVEPSGNCATITPTVTATPTVPECCQCEGSCLQPTMGACPTNCDLVSSAVCLGTNCATITPSATPTPTSPAVPECCQCEGSCLEPTMGACPTNCNLVSSAVCLGTSCATITATATVTPTPTITGAASPTTTNTARSTPTVTPASTATITPTNTPVNTPANTATRTSTGTPTFRPVLDSEACNCTVSAPETGGKRLLFWLAGPVALLLLRRRSRN